MQIISRYEFLKVVQFSYYASIPEDIHICIPFPHFNLYNNSEYRTEF